MKADRKRLKGEKTDLVSQMQQLYATLESPEEQLRDFIRNYEQHRKESEDAVKALAKEKDLLEREKWELRRQANPKTGTLLPSPHRHLGRPLMCQARAWESEDAVKALAKEKDLLEREKWELRRQAKEATDHATALRSQLDLKDNRMKELEAELAMAKQSLATLTKDVPKRHSLAMPGETVLNGNQEWAKQSLATLTKDVPKRHSLAMPGETVLNGNQEWVVQADLPLTAAIRQSQQTLYHSHPPHPADRQAVRVSPCHSRQPSVISDASAAEGDRSSTPSDINSPRHRTHSLCNGDSPGPVQKNLHNPTVQSLEDLEDQKRKRWTHCFLSSTQGAFWRRHFLFCSFLLQEEMAVGREAPCVREGKENPEEGGPGSAAGSVRPGLNVWWAASGPAGFSSQTIPSRARGLTTTTSVPL
ncbi:kazrin isoform A [Camelus ferus]|nr:kazrin isoform A [Camelus ferus]